MDLSSQPIGVYLGSVILAMGIVYQYGIKRYKFGAGDVLLLIVYSYIIGHGLVFLLKGLDYVFNNSSLLGIGPGELKGIVAIGALSGIFAICYFFWKYLAQRNSKS